MIPIVGFTGHMMSGKDTAADYLHDKHGYCRISFAKALRKEVEEALANKANAILPLDLMPQGVRESFESMTAEQVWEKPTTQNARIVLQWWGTDFRRKHNPEYWVRKTLYSMRHGVSYAVSDIRFPNEAEMIHDLGGIVIRLYRPGTISYGIDQHESEKLDFPVDHFIINSGSFEDLYEEIDTCLNLSKNYSPSMRQSSPSRLGSRAVLQAHLL